MTYSDSDNTITKENSLPRISLFEYFVVFVIVLYGGNATTFFESISITENPWGVILPIILSGIIALRMNVRFDKNFYFLLFGFSIYFMAITLKYGEIHPTFIMTYFLKFFIVYVYIKALKSNFFIIYERILYLLAIIGLAFWVIQTGLRGDTLLSIFSKIPGVDSFSNVTGGGYNAIFYSVQPTSHSILYFLIPRNCGYTQEPGCFAVFICLAIFINLFISNDLEKSRKRFIVLVIALVSTMSTTGYIIFMMIMVFYVLSKNLSKILLLLPVAMVGLIYVSTLPFMNNKIIDMVNETNTLDQMIVSTIGQDYESTPQRFTSFMITFVDFRANPILGLGPDNDKSWVNKIGARIAPISGIGNLLAQFGIVGFLFFIITSLRSSFYFASYFNFSSKYLLFFIIIFISVSYSMILLPLLMVFWMFRLFGPVKDENQNSIEDDLKEQNVEINC